MRRRILFAVVSSSLVMLGVAACGGGGGGDGYATASVTVTSPTTTPHEGDTVQLTAIARDQSGNGLPAKVATWSSSNPAIAPVSASGVLQAWGTGDVTVVATVDRQARRPPSRRPGSRASTRVRSAGRCREGIS